MKKLVNLSIVFAVLVSFLFLTLSFFGCDGGGSSGIAGGISASTGALGLTGTIGANSVSAADINIDFVDSSDNLVYTAVTDENGEYTLTHDDLPPGTYTVIPNNDRFTFTPESIENVVIEASTDMGTLGLDFDAVAIPYVKGTITNVADPSVNLYGVQVKLSDEGVTAGPNAVQVTIGSDVSVKLGDQNGIVVTTNMQGEFAFYQLPTDSRTYNVELVLYDSEYTGEIQDLQATDEIPIAFEISRDDANVYSLMLPSDIPQTDSKYNDKFFSYHQMSDMSADATKIVVDSKFGVYVYQLGVNGWTQTKIASLTTNEYSIVESDIYCRLISEVSLRTSISADGSTIVVGQPETALAGGALSVFRLDCGVWSKTATITMVKPDNPYQNYTLGADVALSGDGNTILTSDLDNYIHVFEWDGSNWSETDIGFTGEASGFDISEDGNTIAIGQASDYIIHVLKRDNNWTGPSLHKIGGPGYGNNVSISSDGTKIASNHFTHTWDGSAWTAHNLPGSDINAAISGDGLTVVGIYKPYGYGIMSVYKWDGNAWNKTSESITGDTVYFGLYKFCLSSTGDVALISDGPQTEDNVRYCVLHRIPIRGE